MNEVLIVKSLLEQVKKSGDVSAVHLIIGELAPIIPEKLVEQLNRQVDWNITFEIRKAIIRCPCGYHGKPKIVGSEEEREASCPKCDHAPKIIEGDEIILDKITLKDKEE
ncbi:MAG: hydrogenase/urease maturation nickel metallochaperone HypA [Nanoarchaeota archaeon]